MNNEQLFRQALQRQNDRAARLKMPDDMEQRVMRCVKPRKATRHWLYPITIAAAAASALLLLTLHYSEEPTSELVASDSRDGLLTSKVDAADSRDRLLTPKVDAADSRDGHLTPKDDAENSRDGLLTSKLDSAESRQGEPTSVEALQIEYAQQTNQVQQAEPLTKVLTERDIPITRPENYKYTPEEIALMKRQATEAYLKWVELELEIAKYNQQQTANNY